MSRRKQSNPKPIKRQSEDSLSSVASLLHLPLDSFSLRDPQDEVHESAVFTRRRLKEGATFGPYRGELVPPDEQRANNVFQTQDEHGDVTYFSVTDDAGGWLKLLRRSTAGGDTCCNAALFHNGCAAWCTITTDLEADTQLFVRHQWVGHAPPPPAHRLLNEDSDTENGHLLARTSPDDYCDNMFKCEPSSPPPTSIPGDAFPCGETNTSTDGGPLRCEQCDTFFNSRRILDVHRAYYCGRSVSSDTDTEEAARTEPSTTTQSQHSPDDSPPPKDLSSSTTPESPNSRRRVATDPKRHFRCQQCHYSTDKKASLTRHVRMHGGGMSRAALDGPPVATPPMARYCANCDIQFASYKNYQVHKEFYCNTRHVHKSVASSPPSGQPPPESGPPKPGYNVVLKNQPLYAAISTSPLILVPCSYVAGGEGLIPAGNIVIPDPQAPPAPDPQQKSVLPTFTVMAESEDAKHEAKPQPKSPTRVACKEEPLDLSFRKKNDDHLSDSVSPSSPPAEDTPSLPLATPLQNADLTSRDAGLAAPTKHGASKCVDCNIVFYKHENYLVHKSKYCAARKGREDDSPEKTSREELDAAEDSGPKAGQKSPLSSPRVGNSRTPPQTDGEPLAPVVQYYCVACGIKYSSLDNLRAHQFYYCPKREVQPLSSLVPPYPAALTTTGQDYKCNKCKNAYPTEELLRQHPCVVQRKCPYCDVYCPTLSAAQRHLVTHTGIKSFRCSLCGYKGHTLRGMRTHIRIHLDKNNSTPEEAYILCMDEGGAEIACAGRKSSAVRVVHSERIKSVISTEPPELGMAVSPVSTSLVPTDILAIKAVPDDPVATGDTTHWCQICGYSSSYKGNVVRHVKLVHKDLVATQTMSNIVHSRPSAENLLKQNEPIEHAGRANQEAVVLSTSVTDHSNSSSSMDVKPVVNGLANKSDPALRLEEKPLVLKVETTSPPPGSSKGVKRPLSEDGVFTSKSGPKYCKSCDISFNFLSNFLAHKKFYCTPRQGDVPAQESTQPVQ